LQVADLFAHPAAKLRVEFESGSSNRSLRLEHDGARDSDALLLPRRAPRAIGAPARKVRPGQLLMHKVVDFGFGNPSTVGP